MKGRALLLASSLAGCATGLLSALPVIYIINFFFFAWVWAGAFFAVLLYRNLAGSVRPGQGAVVGLMMSGFAVLTNLLVSNVVGASMMGTNPCIMLVGGAISFLFVIPFPVVGVLGGLLSGVFFDKRS